MDLWLLPGMDGTGELFAPLLRALGRPARVIAYDRSVAGYDELLAHIVPPRSPALLVAESFSGPLAIRLAARAPQQVRGLVLVASFVRAPLALGLRGALLETVLALRPPRAAVRLALLGRDAPDGLVDLARDTTSSVPASTLAARVREVASVDVRGEFAAIAAPIVWLRATRDRLVPARATADARAVRASLDVRDIHGPHLLAQARPAEVAGVVRELAARLA